MGCGPFRWLYAVMFLFWCLSQSATGLATGLGMLILFRILLGIGESVFFPAGVKIVSLLFAPEQRGSASGLFHCGTFAGLFIGAPLTALLISRYGWRHMFLIVGLIGLLWLAPWLAVFPSGRPTGDLRVTANGGRTAGTGISSHHNLLGICLGNLAQGYYWYLLVTWVPDYLMTARHLSLVTAGFYAALPYFTFTVSEPLGGWIADAFIRCGYNETVVRKSVVCLAFFFGLLLIPATRVSSALSSVWLIAGGSLAGLGWANTLAFPQCCAPDNEVGTWTGVMNFAANLGGVVAPLVTGFLIARTGSYTPGFTLGALVLVAGAFSYWFILGELKPTAAVRDRI